MSTIATLTSTESGANSLTDINNNFSALNTDKVEGTGAGTDQLLTVFNSSNKAIKGATGSGFVKTTSGIISNVPTIVETDFGFTDVGTADATSSKHGLLPKTPADSTKFLNGGTGPAFASVKDSDLSLTDITTNDASTGRHGFVPKLGGATGTFYRNDGTFAAPSISNKISIITADVTTPADTNENTIVSVAIPANTLGTANAVNCRLNISNFTMNTNGTYTIRFKYGATTMVSLVIASGGINGSGYIDFVLLSGGTTSSQEAFCMVDAMAQQAPGTGTVEVRYNGVGTAAIDSTASQNLVITSQGANSNSGQITMSSAIIEKIF